MSAGIRLAALLSVVPVPLVAQGFLEQFSYEGLGFKGVGAEFGVVASDRLTQVASPALRVDYGEIAPRLRVMFGASYFRGDFNDSEIAKFESTIAGVVQDPTNDFTISVGRVTLTDVEADASLQYLFTRSRRFTTYMGAGLGVHVRNGSGPAIDGTFVEDALDTIAAGFALSFGFEVGIASRLRFTADFRGGLTSELRTASARAGLAYHVPGGAR